IGGGRRAADRIGIELHELAETPRAWFFVAIDVAGAIAAVRLRQRIEIFRDVTRQRRGQVVAQADPLLVIVLEREHALVRAVLVGQEFSERIGELHRRGFHRLKAVKFENFADFLDHLPGGGDGGGATIFQPARQARLQFLGFFRFFGHVARCQVCQSMLTYKHAELPADALRGKRRPPLTSPRPFAGRGRNSRVANFGRGAWHNAYREFSIRGEKSPSPHPLPASAFARRRASADKSAGRGSEPVSVPPYAATALPLGCTSAV